MYGQSGWRHTPGMPQLDSFDARNGAGKSQLSQATKPKTLRHKKYRGYSGKPVGDDSGYSSKHKKAVMNYG